MKSDREGVIRSKIALFGGCFRRVVSVIGGIGDRDLGATQTDAGAAYSEGHKVVDRIQEPP